jgi:hypothetical protein
MAGKGDRRAIQGIEPSPLHEAIKRAQALVRSYIPEERSLADELVEERRREAATDVILKEP